MPGSEREVFIGFGSNLGDRWKLINQAIEAVTGLPQSRLVKLSSLYETAPVGYLDQGAFLNGVLQLRSLLPPRRLLEQLLAIESRLGRVRVERWGPRTIDLDIIIIGDEIIDREELKVPHPEMAGRRFVLEPLAELAPDLVHPVKQQTITEILNQFCQANPAAEAAFVVAPPVEAVHEVKDGIFYRYRQP